MGADRSFLSSVSENPSHRSLSVVSMNGGPKISNSQSRSLEMPKSKIAGEIPRFKVLAVYYMVVDPSRGCVAGY